MRILIGYDGSTASSEVLFDLCSSGLPDEAEVLILAVAGSPALRSLDEAKPLALAAKQSIARSFPHWNINTETSLGAPQIEIPARARTYKPDLILIGHSQTEPKEQEPRFGQTSRALLAEAECSVRIARCAEQSELHPLRILAGFDGSEGAVRVVESIASRNWPKDSEVRLLVVADLAVLRSIGRFTPQMTNVAVETKFASQWSESLAAPPSAKLIAAGIPASIRARVGHAKDEIIAEAEAWKADIIFVGPHCSSSSMGDSLIGGVSAYVAANATCSVEVVRCPSVRQNAQN